MKVGIVGSGLVGSTAAYALVMQGIGREIVLVDHSPARAQAEAQDIAHAVPFAHPLLIRAGDYADLAGCRVVVIAAGVAQREGETRLQLLARNADVFRQVVPAILRCCPETLLVVATNPVDVMTHLTTNLAAALGVPQQRVLGTGTTLDTARFRTLLGQQFDIDSRHVHAYVIGEHGDSEVLTWSLATIAGVSLPEFATLRDISLNQEVRDRIDTGVRRAAYTIIAGKRATYYGIGSAIARIVDVLLHDQRSVLTVCSCLDNVAGVANVTLSLPHVLGGDGVLQTIPLTLDAAEQAALQRSANIIRAAAELEAL